MGLQKTDAFKKIEQQSKSLTRKTIGLDKFKANIDAVRAQMNSTKKAMTSRIQTEQVYPMPQVNISGEDGEKEEFVVKD
jgi:hypothetical protein